MHFVGCLPFRQLQGSQCRDQGMAGRYAQASSYREGHQGTTPRELAASDGKVTVNDCQCRVT